MRCNGGKSAPDKILLLAYPMPRSRIPLNLKFPKRLSYAHVQGFDFNGLLLMSEV